MAKKAAYEEFLVESDRVTVTVHQNRLRVEEISERIHNIGNGGNGKWDIKHKELSCT